MVFREQVALTVVLGSGPFCGAVERTLTSSTAVESVLGGKGCTASELGDDQTGDQLEVADVVRSHSLAEFQGTGSDEQIR
jgi:hypothetical protein